MTATNTQASSLRTQNTGMPSERDIVTGIAKTAWQSPKVRRLIAFWLVGLFCMLLAPAPVKVTPEVQVKYESMLIDAANVAEYGDVLAEVRHAEADVQRSKVWFWRFRQPYRDEVAVKQARADRKRAALEKLDAEREAKVRQAKGYVGLWSEYGVEEARTRFWDAFEAGKVFASRQTFWQMFWGVMSSREENVLGIMLNWVFTALINFTFALLGSLFYFFFSLLSMIYSYQPDPFSAVAFFLLAMLGGASLVGAYLLAIYGMAASSVYVVGKMAVRNAQLQYEEQHRIRSQYTQSSPSQPQHSHHHYD